MAQHTGQFDQGEGKESEVTREVRVERRWGQKEKEEKRGWMADEEEMEEEGERGEEKRKGDAPQVLKVSNKIRVALWGRSELCIRISVVY